MNDQRTTSNQNEASAGCFIASIIILLFLHGIWAEFRAWREVSKLTVALSVEQSLRVDAERTLSEAMQDSREANQRLYEVIATLAQKDIKVE